MLSNVANDFRLAARRLLAAPLFSAFAVVSLAVGIGVTTIAYSVVDDLFFSEVSVADPARVALVGPPQSGSVFALTLQDFDALQSTFPSFSTLTGTSSFTAAVGTVEGPTELLLIEAVAPDYFSTIGVMPAAGRLIQTPDETSHAPVAVVSHAYWQRKLGSDARAAGRGIRIGRRSFEIVGVVPESYRGFPLAGPGRTTAVWIPLATIRSANSEPRVAVFGRLRSGSTIDQAATEIGRAAAVLDSSDPQVAQAPASTRQRRWTVRTFVDVDAERTSPTRRLGVVVAGLVLMVLVVACTNLANLVLARGTTRQQEIAVRRALGAARWRLVREQLAESTLIAAAGGIGAYVVMRALAAILPRDLPLFFISQRVMLRTDLDTQTLLTATVVLLVSLVVFGLEPAIQLTWTSDVRGRLAATAGGVGMPNDRRHRLLVRWQVAVSAAFFILAVTTINTVFATLRHDSGIDLQRLVIAQLNFYAQQWDEARSRRVLDRVLSEARRAPGVASVDASTGMPFGTDGPFVELSTVNRMNGNAPVGRLVASTPGFFRTSGVRIIRGRAFDERDGTAAAAIVVSETTARALFRTTDVIGRQLFTRVRGRSDAMSRVVTISGVAADTDTFFYMTRGQGLVVYAPLNSFFDGSITIIGRAAAGTTVPVSVLEAAIRRADPDLAIAAIGSGPALLSGPYGLVRRASLTSLCLGLLTLAMSMVGLYGVQSIAVGRRSREIGVRVSFGATAAQVKRMVLKDGYRPVFEGMAIGLFMGVAGRAIVRAFGGVPIAVLDPWMLAAVPVPLLFAAFCACYLPARRAAAVDPMIALRDL